jgi:hypothetical protein
LGTSAAWAMALRDVAAKPDSAKSVTAESRIAARVATGSRVFLVGFSDRTVNSLTDWSNYAGLLGGFDGKKCGNGDENPENDAEEEGADAYAFEGFFGECGADEEEGESESGRGDLLNDGGEFGDWGKCGSGERCEDEESDEPGDLDFGFFGGITFRFVVEIGDDGGDGDEEEDA